MRHLCIVITFLFFWLLPPALKATHIVGGEMTYKCLGNNLYEIKLTIFRDCFYGNPQAWFDSLASIGVFDVNNVLLNEIKVPLTSQNDTLNPDLGSPCFVVPPDVCVHTTTYTATAFLPFKIGGYQLVYQRCCRNQTIANIVAPLSVGATYSINLTEAALLLCNSSPQFNNWPPLYICVNHPFEIDQSATDADGDSLVYKLCNPLTGASQSSPMPQPPNNPPYVTVPWVSPPYNTSNMLNGLPGGVPMTIHPQTGLLTGTPNTIGQFVIGICIEEYRDGQLISISRRDYQVKVGDCGIVTSSFFAPEVLCETYSVQFNNQSSNAANYLWYFDYPDNLAATSNLSNPVFTYTDTGLYTIMLVAEPGALCTDTFISQIRIVKNSLFAGFAVEEAECSDELTIDITESSVDTIAGLASWNWQLMFGQNTLQSSEQHPSFTITEQGIATLTLTVTSTNGCVQTLVQTFPVEFIEDPILKDSTAVCQGGGSIELNPDGSFPGATYLWQPPGGLSDPTSPNPIATVDTTITYSVTITDSDQFCVVEKKVTIVVPPQVTVTPVLDTILEGQSVQLLATFDPGFSYSWSPATGLNAANIHNPVATPLETTIYTLTVTDKNGCIEVRTVTIVVLSICREPFLFIPTGFTPNGDGKNDIFTAIGNYIEDLYLVVYNRWGEKVFETTTPGDGWDGTYKGKQLPPDAFGFYVKIRCIGGTEFFKKGNVTLLR